ncbi:MAG: hypothetical protein NT062_25760, partial [Proteobacteria bacterium]|nr:hypothetical protein [Pseudomonadota bacterium]
SYDARTGAELGRIALDRGPRYPFLAQISPTGRFALHAVCRAPGACGTTFLSNTNGPITSIEGALAIDGLGGVRIAMLDDGELTAASLAFADDDSAVAIQRPDRIDVIGPRGQVIRTIARRAGCDALAVAAAGALVATACDGAVQIWRAGAEMTALPGPVQHPSRLVFVGPDRLLALGDHHTLWNLDADHGRGELRGETAASIAETRAAAGAGIQWARYLPGTHQRLPPLIATSFEIGSEVEPASLLEAAPRVIPDGVIVAQPRAWSVLMLRGDQLYEVVTTGNLPDEAPPACVPRAALDRHGVLALDGGRRLLVDEQELPASRPTAYDHDRFRHPTIAEVPLRELRPARASERAACLLWGDAIGAHVGDVVELPGNATAAAVGDSLLVLATPAIQIARDGARTTLTTLGKPDASFDRAYVVSQADGRAAITRVATNTVVRTWAVAPDTTLWWVARDVVGARVGDHETWVPADPSLPPRAADPALALDAGATHALRHDGAELVVVRVADGVVRARHRGAAREVLVGDDTGRVIVDDGDHGVVLALDGGRVVLPGVPETTPGGTYALVERGDGAA